MSGSWGATNGLGKSIESGLILLPGDVNERERDDLKEREVLSLNYAFSWSSKCVQCGRPFARGNCNKSKCVYCFHTEKRKLYRRHNLHLDYISLTKNCALILYLNLDHHFKDHSHPFTSPVIYENLKLPQPFFCFYCHRKLLPVNIKKIISQPH